MRTQVVATKADFRQLRGVSRETLLRKKMSRRRLKCPLWGQADTEQAMAVEFMSTGPDEVAV